MEWFWRKLWNATVDFSTLLLLVDYLNSCPNKLNLNKTALALYVRYSLVKMSWIAEQGDFSKSWAYTGKYDTWKIMRMMQYTVLFYNQL